jgi:(1->4)-alpha-D-glucan 1-alpha-D-glucosylmutase
VLEDQQLKVTFQDGTFCLNYYDRRFPIAPGSYKFILNHRLDQLETLLGNTAQPLLEYHSILTAISHLPPRNETVPERREERKREKEIIKRRIQRLCLDSPEIGWFIRDNVFIFNGRRGEPASFDLLDNLLNHQAYRLAFWRVAADEINYRRFFDVNELAAISMERPDVFERTHALIWKLFQTRRVEGIRIDHADGLFDPTGYLWQIQRYQYFQLCRSEYDSIIHESPEKCPAWESVEAVLDSHFEELRASGSDSPLLQPLFVVVEKILERTERLPVDWPVQGTTGYEFLNELNGLYVDGSKAKQMDGVYTKFTGQKTDFRELTYEAKRLILKVSMSSELHVLGHKLDRLSERNRCTRDFTLHGLIQALREVIACFPIYRTYTVAEHVLDRDRDYIDLAVSRARHRNPAVSGETFDFIREILLRAEPSAISDEERAMRDEFVGRFQQFTGPMMAKSVEDTAFYRFNRLISLNEVGGDPERFGITVAEFHERNQERQLRYPYGLLATSTHDTKRSEDVRARINVLSEIPIDWKARVLQWAKWNKQEKTKLDGELAPSRNDEYLLYQTLVGAWPLNRPTGQALSEFIARILQYMTKAVREAKLFSSWIAPNREYERAMHAFIVSILVDDPSTPFRTDFEHFSRQIAEAGFWNSLSQTLIKLTSPGVPDIYQGTELWDFSLVDPDNRRTVDYRHRQIELDSLEAGCSTRVEVQTAFVTHLMTHADDGRIKLLLLQRALELRNRFPQLFSRGDYLPIEVQGLRKDNIVAYARAYENQMAIVIAPRLCATQVRLLGKPPLGADFWKDTRIALPKSMAVNELQNALTGKITSSSDDSRDVFVSEYLQHVPVALLVTRGDNHD